MMKTANGLSEERDEQLREATRMMELKTGEDLSGIRPKVGIVVEDAVSRRLIEAASVHLELIPCKLTLAEVETISVREFELIVADEVAARLVGETLERREEQVEGVNPAVIAVRTRGTAVQGAGPVTLDGREHEFEGVLTLPQEPGATVAQLGLFLYAHRAYARRYENALEELHLNRRIFRSVTSGISVANATMEDMPLVYVNPAFEVMTGYSLEEVRGLNCRFLQNGENDQPGLTLIREALKAEREVVAVIRNYRKDGTAFWNELALSPIRNRDGQLTHVVGIQMDVTARVEFEAALRESEKLAAVGRLAASIAHEINNPLESVMNLLYLAREAADEGAMRDYIGQADKELQRVAQITSQSLRFYKQSTKPQAVRCADLLEGVLDVYHGRLLNAHVKLEVRERMAESIVCLESEIRQVLSNLVRNAIDAMMGTGGRLLVRSREATEWKHGVRGVMLTVADTGTGISAETKAKMYTAFFTTKGIGGTGLGLWVSSEIVQRNSGRLWVRSSQKPGGGGTVFQLFLPYQGLSN
jgi:two-component system sporulation sensor kinase C